MMPDKISEQKAFQLLTPTNFERAFLAFMPLIHHHAAIWLRLHSFSSFAVVRKAAILSHTYIGCAAFEALDGSAQRLGFHSINHVPDELLPDIFSEAIEFLEAT